MSDTDVLNRLTVVLRKVFHDDEIVATPDLTAKKVKGWNSLGNVRLLVEIERTFSIRFEATEIASLDDVGQMAALIREKMA